MAANHAMNAHSHKLRVLVAPLLTVGFGERWILLASYQSSQSTKRRTFAR
jgi:hypothetical protein